MAKYRFFIDYERKEKLEVNSMLFGRNVTATLNGDNLEKVEGKNLKNWIKFRTSDGREILVKSSKGLHMIPTLDVMVGNKEITNYVEAQTKFQNSYIAIFFIGILNTIFGLSFVFVGNNTFMWLTVFLMGCLFIVLGFFVSRFRTKIALAFALGLFLLDSFISLFVGLGNVGFILVRFALIGMMLMGFGAISKLNNYEKEKEMP